MTYPEPNYKDPTAGPMAAVLCIFMAGLVALALMGGFQQCPDVKQDPPATKQPEKPKPKFRPVMPMRPLPHRSFH